MLAQKHTLQEDMEPSSPEEHIEIKPQTLQLNDEVSTKSPSHEDRLTQNKNKEISFQPREQEPDPANIVPADIALAKWWKQEGKIMYSDCVTMDPNVNATTRIQILAKSKPGQTFLRREIKRLKHLLTSFPQSEKLHYTLATHYEKCRQWNDAKCATEDALKLQSESDESFGQSRWLLAKICRQMELMEKQRIFLSKVPESMQFPAISKVEKREASSFSYDDFYHNFATTSTPVIIKGLANQITSCPWNLDHIKQIAGDRKVQLKRLKPNSTEWARLDSTETVTVREFIESLAEQLNKPLDEKRYLFDWSIPLNCPRLAEELVIPKYFSADMLLKTTPGSLYHDSWPSLFIAPAGLRSELHVDAFGSNFWMAMFEGSKRWLFFDTEDVPFLYPDYSSSLDPVFDVDLSHPDVDKFPLLSLTHPKECILEAGDVLFVPAGCPHRVENLETSLAISSNFVDTSNIELVKSELKINGYIDERAKDLLHQLEAQKLNLIEYVDRKDCSLNELKSCQCE